MGADIARTPAFRTVQIKRSPGRLGNVAMPKIRLASTRHVRFGAPPPYGSSAITLGEGAMHDALPRTTFIVDALEAAMAF